MKMNVPKKKENANEINDRQRDEANQIDSS